MISGVRRPLAAWEAHLEEALGVEDASSVVDVFDRPVGRDDLDRTLTEQSHWFDRALTEQSARFDRALDEQSARFDRALTEQSARLFAALEASEHRLSATFERQIADAVTSQTRTLVTSQLGALVAIAALAFGLR